MNEAGPSDERLSAELKKWTGGSPALHPVGELLDRHWEAAFAYARLCTDGTRAAGMLSTAAFTRLFGESLRQNGPTAAWRPEVLVAVRRIAAEWDTDGRRELLHPELRSGAAGERAAARLLPPPGRRQLSRAFQRVPQASRAVLWHTEVESEPLAVPAALLGLDEEDTRVELRRARERLREECLQVHRELAPDTECQRYLRMLDVTFRRGGVDIDPDLRRHLDGCGHCGRTADQLTAFNKGLGLALAEAVLGWAAHAYVESRATRAGQPTEPTPPPPVAAPLPDEALPATETPRRRGSSHAAGRAVAAAPADRGETVVSGRSARRAARARRARRRHLALAVVTVSGLVVVPLVLWSVLGSGHGVRPAGGGASSPAPGKNTRNPGASWTGANAGGQGAVHGRLHNLASGLCIDVVGKKAVEGAETELAPCSATPSQQWTYETDGLLRNSAAPDLCLDSHLGYSVRLAPCSATGEAARNIRYDFTLQGTLIPRWNQELALTPAATDGSGALVLKDRAPGTAQRWGVDTAKPELQMQNVNWGSDSPPSPTATPHRTTRSATPTPKASRPSASPTPTVTTSPAPTPSATFDPCSAYPYYCGDGGGGYGGSGYGDGRHRR
ncbi:hydrolase [Streptomyces sp. IMTB 2501]|uniref:RICIN domain-containing protein n=1 Tax=Streptomyces sp. IMTB 2501 TaxID=1776340 RepID=UPI00096C4CB2|nr:RICIN domain-containing protein [Streptomyces sp. IMTB 2501]OLZ74465.1 hydrolase [Streptomyces sp. IMTB 2501]